MVVVSIIGILAALGIPRVFAYVRVSETAEVSQVAGRILAGIRAYSDTQLKTAVEIVSQTDGTELTPDGSGVELTKIIPTLVLPTDANFSYQFSSIVAISGPEKDEAVFCIIATAGPSAGVPGGKVLVSSTPSTFKGWDGIVNRIPYVNGETDLSSVRFGGYCNAIGAANKNCVAC